MSTHRSYRLSIRPALETDTGLDWTALPEVDYRRTALVAPDEAAIEARCQASAREQCREAAAREPGTLFGVFVNPDADPLTIDPRPLYTARLVAQERAA